MAPKTKKPKALTLTEISTRIDRHLKRMQDDPKINKESPQLPGHHPFYWPNAGIAGRYVRVVYVTYQGGSNLTREQALRYLEWLDHGNNGKHFALTKT